MDLKTRQTIGLDHIYHQIQKPIHVLTGSHTASFPLVCLAGSLLVFFCAETSSPESFCGLRCHILVVGEIDAQSAACS
jgi:hypothetical protein